MNKIINKIIGNKNLKRESIFYNVNFNKYTFELIGKRGNINIEDVEDYLRIHSTSFRVIEEGYYFTSAYGVIEGNKYMYKYHHTPTGIPSIIISTETKQELENIRRLIHNLGWKGNKSSKL